MTGAAPNDAAEAIAADMKAFGFAPSDIDRCLAQIKPPDPAFFTVLPANADTVRLFLACQTQWRRAGLEGAPTGLDYTGCGIAAQACGLALEGELFDGLRTMEIAALGAMHEERRNR